MPEICKNWMKFSMKIHKMKTRVVEKYKVQCANTESNAKNVEWGCKNTSKCKNNNNALILILILINW